MTRSIFWRVVVAVAATACFGILLYTFSDIAGIRSALAASSPGWIIVGATTTVMTIFLRAIRASLAVDGRVDGVLGSISVVHNAMTALLPMKLGEFAFPMLLAKLGRLRPAEGVGVLLLLRALDFTTLGLIGSLAIYFSLRSIRPDIANFAIATFLVACTTLASAMVAWNRITSTLHEWSTSTTYSGVVRRLLVAATGLERRQMAMLLLLSALIWASLFSAFYFFSLSVHGNVRIVDIVAIGTVSSLAFAFPVSGVANTGPFQAAWVWMSVILGLDSVTAMAAALLAHGMIIVVTVAFGLAVLPVLMSNIRRSDQERDGSPGPAGPQINSTYQTPCAPGQIQNKSNKLSASD